jgi:hypothetical protein
MAQRCAGIAQNHEVTKAGSNPVRVAIPFKERRFEIAI